MARRGAMTKNPVLRGEARKNFKKEQYKNLPGPGQQVPITGNNQTLAQQIPQKSPPVTARPPREKPMERLSPGVYRGAEGGLVGTGGKAIQRQPQPQSFANKNTQPFFQPSYINFDDFMKNLGDRIYAKETGSDLPYNTLDKMYRYPEMPQPSANMGGQYRLSPGVYGTQEQAMRQYDKQMQAMGIYNQDMQQMGVEPAMSFNYGLQPNSEPLAVGQPLQQQNPNLPAGFYNRRNYFGQPMK